MSFEPPAVLQEIPTMLGFETQLWNEGVRLIAGIDEAGRGPLAGPVVAAAVVFEPGVFIPGVNDSKTLTAHTRERLFGQIQRQAISVGVGVVHHDIIDAVNILNATFRAMHEAVAHLHVRPDHLLIDGNRFAGTGIPFSTIVDGDALCHSIAAASIVAKVTRDRMMVELDAQFPGYGFAQHKGYGTKQHREAIRQIGLCTIHRRSFKSDFRV